MIDILVESYLSREKSTRQDHLNLDDPCLERGGISTNHRGVLAQYLNTPIYGRPADLCHACHNDKCSNPKHLYWGTRKENVADARSNGTHISPWANTVAKYGLEEAKRMNARGDKSAGGRQNKGKEKSEEHKRKIAASVKRHYVEKN
jgi:hypothetical protein